MVESYSCWENYNCCTLVEIPTKLSEDISEKMEVHGICLEIINGNLPKLPWFQKILFRISETWEGI